MNIDVSLMQVWPHGPYLVQESLYCKIECIAYYSISGLYDSVMLIIGQAFLKETLGH